MIYETQMRNKMFKAAMAATRAPRAQDKRSIISAVATAMDTGMGKRTVKDWNAHLSMGTYNRLKDQGVMA
jgi:hypothetical protein